MTISPGVRLGPYEIVSRLGAGGMGEVWLASDSRLERRVAIKVLPPHFATNEEMRRRFEREAKAISALSHPHICTVYDVGREGGTEYLVMEYLEGQTLAERLLRGPLPIDQVLRYAIEIASALERAHRAGIIHRDLKPGNIMLTPSGAKLLDFGLAKPNSPIFSSHVSDTGATEAVAAQPITEDGALIGTFQYMSPEQLEGEPADVRSDIFSFGAVLYEMSTGRQAFAGKSRASIIASVLQTDPEPITVRAPLTPAAFERVVAACLTKKPDERWQSARDLLFELEWMAKGAVEMNRPVTMGRRAAAMGIGAAIVVLGVAVVAGRLFRRPTVPAPVLTTGISAPEGTQFDFLRGSMVFSPDGKSMAFIARGRDGNSSIYVRDLATGAVRALAGTEGATAPFWSSDSQSIGYYARNAVMKIDVSGGVPTTIIGNAGSTRGAIFTRDGSILASNYGGGPILKIAAGKRIAESAVDRSRGEVRHLHPSMLPDGQHYLFLVQTTAMSGDAGEIWVGTLGTNERKYLLQASSQAVFAPPGFLVFCRGGNLIAQRFDDRALSVQGEPFVIASHVQRNADFLLATFAVSSAGVIAYEPGGDVGLSRLERIGRDGKVISEISPPGNLWGARLSHDGHAVAVEEVDRLTRNRDVWVFDVQSSIPPARLTFDSADDYTPVFSPDDRSVVFARWVTPEWHLIRKAATGAGPEDIVGTTPGGAAFVTSWSSEWIAVNRSRAGAYDIEAFSPRTRSWKKITDGASDERDADFSPDGRWIVYASNESTHYEIYVRSVDSPGDRWQISTSGGTEPRWSRDGREIFYLAPDGTLTAVPVTTAASFNRGGVHPLFETNLRASTIAEYDVMPDGRSFVMNVNVGDETAVPIVLLQNRLPPR